jgi:multiple sugar transport system permease protein
MTLLGLTNKPVDWLFDTRFAAVTAVIATAWRTVPLFALLLLAALKTIPETLYRAAKMDGATPWQSFRYITLPGINRMLIVVTALTVIGALQVFDILFTLTRGGPGRETTMVIYYIYEATTGLLSFGYGSTMGIALLAATLAFTSLVWIVRLRGRSLGAIADDTAELSATPSLPPVLRAASFRAARTWSTEDGSPSDRRRFRVALPPWLGRVALGATALILIVWLVGPIAWIAIASVTPEGYITHVPPLVGQAFSLDAYTKLLQNPAWAGSIVVSLQVAIYTTIITLVMGALAAYPLARLDVPGKGLITAGIIVTQTVPSIVLAIPTLFIFRAFGLADTIAGLVVVNVAFLLPLVIWLLRNVFEGVPRALESAARIDGCSRIGALFRITVPAAAPGIAAVVILSLIAVWNEFTFAVILGNRNTVTVTRQIGFIDTTNGPLGIPPFSVLAAAGIIAIVPCLVLVILFHRRVVAGITEGFVKG